MGAAGQLDNIFVERLWRSVKHEDVYLKGYTTMSELLVGLTEHFVLYNTERPPNHYATTRQIRSIVRRAEAEPGL